MAYKFASKGYNLFLVLRRQMLLEAVKHHIEERYKVSALIYRADLTNPKIVYELYKALTNHELSVLINNAGFGDFSFPWDMDIEKAS